MILFNIFFFLLLQSCLYSIIRCSSEHCILIIFPRIENSLNAGPHSLSPLKPEKKKPLHFPLQFCFLQAFKRSRSTSGTPVWEFGGGNGPNNHLLTHLNNSPWLFPSAMLLWTCLWMSYWYGNIGSDVNVFCVLCHCVLNGASLRP